MAPAVQEELLRRKNQLELELKQQRQVRDNLTANLNKTPNPVLKVRGVVCWS